MTGKKMNKRRLLRLADHLDHGKLGHKVFDFCVLNIRSGRIRKGCGTAGCALGEMPIIAPKRWMFDHRSNYVPVLRHTSMPNSFSSAEKWFGIDRDHVELLFVPGIIGVPRQHAGVDPDLVLLRNGPRATKHQVASSIRRYVRLIERRQKIAQRNACPSPALNPESTLASRSKRTARGPR